jgi:hypothetical protein
MIDKIFWLGVLSAPLISFLIVRRFTTLNATGKVIATLFIVALLWFLLYIVGFVIMAKNRGS